MFGFGCFGNAEPKPIIDLHNFLFKVLVGQAATFNKVVFHSPPDLRVEELVARMLVDMGHPCNRSLRLTTGVGTNLLRILTSLISSTKL